MPGATRAPTLARRHFFARSRTRRVVFTPCLNSSSVGRAAEPGEDDPGERADAD